MNVVSKLPNSPDISLPAKYRNHRDWAVTLAEAKVYHQQTLTERLEQLAEAKISYLLSPHKCTIIRNGNRIAKIYLV